jgi:copper homeostasis protein
VPIPLAGISGDGGIEPCRTSITPRSGSRLVSGAPEEGHGMVLVEAAVETVAAARRAVLEGAGRLELCADLPRDGVTPSAGLIRTVRALVEVPLHVLIRPRPGDFTYDAPELAVMLADIAECRRAGVDGVVIGALTAEHRVDREQTARLVEAARPLSVTFHRAVDRTEDLAGAVTTLLELGVERILTAGGMDTARAGAPELARLQRSFGHGITIMAGGRVRGDNVSAIVAAGRVEEVHVGLPGNGEPGRIAAVVAALAGAAAGGHRPETP